MLFEVDPINLHYMTNRQERFDLKISKLKILWKQRHQFFKNHSNMLIWFPIILSFFLGFFFFFDE